MDLVIVILLRKQDAAGSEEESGSPRGPEPQARQPGSPRGASCAWLSGRRVEEGGRAARWTPGSLAAAAARAGTENLQMSESWRRVTFPQPGPARTKGPAAAGARQLLLLPAGVWGQGQPVGSHPGCTPSQLGRSHDCLQSRFPRLSRGEDHSKNGLADIYGILTIPDALGH